MILQVLATHLYTNEDEDELSFEAGELIYVMPFDDPDDQVMLKDKLNTIITDILVQYKTNGHIRHNSTKYSRNDFFQLFNGFQLFSSDKNIPKVAGHGQNS